MPRPHIPLRLLLAALTTLLLAACGSGGNAGGPARAAATPPPPGKQGSFPVTVDTPKGQVRIEKKPARIVSLSPSSTETLYAIGAGQQVVAVDRNSNYPAEAPRTDLSGFEPNVEAIAAKQPDLVVISNDTNNLVTGLTKLGIPVVEHPAPKKLDDVYDGIASIGLATGHVDETAAVIAKMRDGIAKAKEKAPKNTGLRVYHELDATYYSASSYSFIGSVYADMGATNIADAADQKKSGYPKLTEESIITADPQLIVITDKSKYTAQDVAKRPGWQNVAAVKSASVVAVNGDIASRWGPRLPELYQALADALSTTGAKAKA